MRIVLLLSLLFLAGCQKPEAQAPSSGRSFESERLKTLTHDTDLIAPKPEAGQDDLRVIGETLRQAASASAADH